jgi:hypothetical protein
MGLYLLSIMYECERIDTAHALELELAKPVTASKKLANSVLL